MVRKMYPSLLSPTLFLFSLFYFLTPLTVVPVRVFSKPVLYQNSFSLLSVWQFANADASHGNLRRSHLRHLRSQQHVVIHDLPSGWTSVGCHTLVILQPFQERQLF